jgi:hypothetical protein
LGSNLPGSRSDASAAGDPLEQLSKVGDFEVLRGELKAALSRSNRAKGFSHIGMPRFIARLRRSA